MTNYLEVKNLSKSFDSFQLHNISFTLPKGYIMGLIGPNGSGKTTTIKLILNMLKRNGGEIKIMGLDNVADEQKAKAELGVVFDTNYFSDDWQVTQVEKSISVFYPNWKSERFAEMLRKFHIAPTKKVKELSKGMQMKLMLACAFSYDAKLLILDEPINGLDPIGIAEVRRFIRELCDVRGKTILISSHILSEIALLADDIGIIDHGVLLEEESLEELEAKNGKYIHFTVSDARAAARLLYTRCGMRDFEVLNEHELTLAEPKADIAGLVAQFVQAGLAVQDAHLCEDTLEDYFKKVTGGEGIG